MTVMGHCFSVERPKTIYKNDYVTLTLLEKKLKLHSMKIVCGHIYIRNMMDFDSFARAEL